VADNFWDLDDLIITRAETCDIASFLGHFKENGADAERKYEKLNFPATAKSIGDWIDAYLTHKREDECLFAISDKAGGLVGYIEVWETDRRMGTFKFGIKISDDKTGRGYATKSLIKILDFYFNELRYQKSDVYIYDFNVRSLEFHKKIGFSEEGRLRRQCFTKGGYHDAICCGLTAEEFNEMYSI
jgi:RimJ/RimL family protein N-acetyltransferase